MPGFVPCNEQWDRTDTDIIIWSAALVATMVGMIEESIVLGESSLPWDAPPWRRIQLQRTLVRLLEREHDDWIIAEVPTALVDELQLLRVEAYRQLRSDRM